MRFAVCSQVRGEEYARSVALCTVSQKQHAKKHGYTRFDDNFPFNSNRDYPWAKIKLLENHLADWDWLVWIDGDVLITNQDCKIEKFIELIQPNKFMMIGEDFQGINSGVFFIRNCLLAHEFIKDVWMWDGYGGAPFFEQTAIDFFIHTPKYASDIQIVPHKYVSIFNAYDPRMDSQVHWKPGDFCIHFAGVRPKTTPEVFHQIQKMYFEQSSSDPSGTERIQAYASSLKTHIVDTFMFYNELDVLELRLTALDAYVDRFILVESEVTHSGQTKPLIFEENKQRFTRWLPKMKHIIVTAKDSPTDENPWSREKFQRECILRGLDDISDDTYVMVSDIDEIPDMLRISFPLIHDVVSVHMWFFEYSFDYMYTGEPWFGTVITRCDTFKRLGPNTLRDNRWKYPVIEYAGWHLSSFGDARHVALKHQTFAHWKDSRSFESTPENFQKLIQNGIHTDGKTKLIPRPPQVPLPSGPDVLYRIFS